MDIKRHLTCSSWNLQTLWCLKLVCHKKKLGPVSFKTRLFLQGQKQYPDSGSGNMECQVHSLVWLHSLAVVAMCFVSLFGFAEVHFRNDISKVNTTSRIQVLDGSSAAHQPPPFVLVWAGHICYTLNKEHIMLTSLFYVYLKVWGISSTLFCIVSPTLTFATQLVCVPSHRRQLGAESQVPSSHG